LANPEKQRWSSVEVHAPGGSPFTALSRPLSRSTVAIVTTAGLHLPEDRGFGRREESFRVIPRDRRDLRLGHLSANFDRSGIATDLNVVYPIDRLEELARDGWIGRVADRQMSFMGAQDESMATLRLDTGPAAAALLLRDGVDAVLLTPI
jgi:D-proline reductase (dithiol) PrdB